MISTIDGTPSAELSLSHIFKQQDKEYVLEVIRGDEKKQIKLKLRRLIWTRHSASAYSGLAGEVDLLYRLTECLRNEAVKT